MVAGHYEGDESNLDFHQLMRQATQMKEAQLAEKRKEWTSAPMFLKATYSPSEDIKSVRQNGTEHDRVAAIQERKARGNEKFREKDYDAAQAFYSDAIAVVHYFEQIGEDMPFRRTEDTFANDQETVTGLLSQCYSNVAACLFQQKKLEELCFAADKAISLRPETAAKAYFRRGYGKLLFGTIDDLDDVQHDLQKALSISPKDAQIKRALRQLANERAKYRTASKKVYAKAFQSETAAKKAPRRAWVDRIAELAASRRILEQKEGSHEKQMQSLFADRLYRLFLYAIILLSTVLLVRLSVRLYKLSVVTFFRHGEL